MAELKSLKDALRKKDSETALARRDLEAELNMAKQALAAANKKAASAGPVDASESAKDSHVIKLYEDMTNLNIPVIKVSQSKLGDEVTFVCVQTVGEQSGSQRDPPRPNANPSCRPQLQAPAVHDGREAREQAWRVGLFQDARLPSSRVRQ